MKRAAVLLSIALLSAGCATTREAISLPELDSWETRTAVLGDLREWEFRGRIAVKADDEGFNGKIRWIQDGGAFNTTVGGPIGIGTVRIEGSGQTGYVAYVRDAGGDPGEVVIVDLGSGTSVEADVGQRLSIGLEPAGGGGGDVEDLLLGQAPAGALVGEGAGDESVGEDELAGFERGADGLLDELGAGGHVEEHGRSVEPEYDGVKATHARR